MNKLGGPQQINACRPRGRSSNGAASHKPESLAILGSVSRGIHAADASLTAAAGRIDVPCESVEDLRDCALSIACFERQLSIYLAQVLDRAGHQPPTRVTFDLRLLDLIESCEELSEQVAWKLLPPGGVMSLLYFVNMALVELHAALAALPPQGGRCRGRLFVFRADAAAHLHGVAFRLSVLQRMYVVAGEVWTKANPPSTGLGAHSRSYTTMIANVSDADFAPERMNQARRLLQAVPPPGGTAMWTSLSPAYRSLVRGMNAYYAAIDFVYPWVKAGGARRLAAAPVGFVAVGAFFLLPRAAERRVALIFRSVTSGAEVDVGFVKLAWMLLDAPVARAVARLLHPNLPTVANGFVGGCDVHFMGNVPVQPSLLGHQPPPSSSPSPLLQPPALSMDRLVQLAVSWMVALAAALFGPLSQAFSRSWASAVGPPAHSQLPVAASRPRRLSSTPSDVFRAPPADAAGDEPCQPEGSADGPPSSSAASPGLPLDESPGGGCMPSVIRRGSTPPPLAVLRSLRDPPVLPPTLLWIHGGGFVGSSFASDSVWLSQTAASCPSPLLIVFPHYTLAGTSGGAGRYPTALNELLEVYRWLRPRTHVLVCGGDSAGGNLTAALTLRCIDEGMPLPQRVVMAYPALQLSPAPGTARALSLHDPIVPVALLQALARAYVPRSYAEAATDPYIHPLLATDDQLRRFPPTFLVSGGLDPLLDDAVDFNTRLRRVGVPGLLMVSRTLPHGFLNFPALPGADAAISQLRRYITEAVSSTAATE